METSITQTGASSSRRDFFKRAGLGVGVIASAATLQACDSTNDTEGDVTLDFSDDFGVLNYAYALEQLEAAFYAQAIATPYSGMSSSEMSILQDLAKHEQIHKAFLATALGANAIPGLTPDFSSVNFGNRASVLGTAQVFEDLGVGAYNGAGKYISDTGYLLVAGKIVSVEARHASVIADLLSNNTIASSGQLDSNALDKAYEPDFVLSQAGKFIKESIGLKNVRNPIA